MGVVADLNPAAVGALTLVQLSVSQTVDDAIFPRRFLPGSSVVATDVIVADSGDVGLHLSAVADGRFDDFSIERSGRFGLLLDGATDNRFGVSATVRNRVVDNDDGVQLTGGADGNVLQDFLIAGSADDGAIFSGATNNRLKSSEIEGNGDAGVLFTNSSSGNVLRGNVILANGCSSVLVAGGGTNAGNTVAENCLRNSLNALDDEAGAANAFDDGVLGNFWGSLAADGTGYSEACTDRRLGTPPLNDDICDAHPVEPFPYGVPGVGGSSDRFPLQQCVDFASPGNVSMRIEKEVLTVDDPVNATLPKAIPGATLRYTVTASNLADSGIRSGMAESARITDSLDAFVSIGALSWIADSMVRTAPDYDGGATTPLTDADSADDDASFGVIAPNTLVVECGDLNASEQCTITFEVRID